MKIGIMDTFLAADSREEAFRRAAEAGAEGVEVMYFTPEQAGQLDADDHAARLKALATESGLAVPSLCIGVLNQTGSLTEGGKPAEKGLQRLRRAIAVAAEAGAGVVLVPFFERNAIETEDELAKVANVLNEVVEPAEQAGVTLGVESTLNADRIEYLLDALSGSPNVGVYCDPGNAIARKLDPVTFIRDLGPGRIAQVHFKDVRMVSGEPPDFDVPLGEGEVDFRGVVQALRAVDYDGWVIIEAGGGDDPVDAARRNLGFTRDMLGA
jgi:inosose dehydratase